MSVHFSSQSDEWSTPQWLYNILDQEFGFGIDVCATQDNAKCPGYLGIEQDGLMYPWSESLHTRLQPCWMNPPYSQLKLWVKKAYEESQKGCTVVCLIPSRTDTVAWHDYVMKGEIRFIRGRLKFGGSENSAPFPSAVVIFRPDRPERILGQVIDARGR